MKIDLVADLFGEADLVGDDEHRHPFRGELAHRVEDLFDELGVERGGDLVEEHHVRFHRQRPGDRDALLLAAGEPFRVLVDFVAEADPFEQGARLSRRPRPCSCRAPCAAPGSRSRARVLWGKRLNCWKTMPTRWRTKSSSQLCSPVPDPGPLQMSWPSRKISPSSGGSSRLTQRSRVLLPEPLGPRMQTTSPLPTSRSIAFQHFELAEAFVDALELEHRLRHQATSMWAPRVTLRLVALDQDVDQPGQPAG